MGTALGIRQVDVKRPVHRRPVVSSAVAVPGATDITPAYLHSVEWHETPVFGALSHYFAVRTNDALLGSYVTKLLAPLASPKKPPACWYSLVNRCGSRKDQCSVYYGAEQLSIASDAHHALSRLLHHANRRAIEGSTSELVVHAAAAEHRGRALLFPAPPGAGKSTLVAALVRAGLRYLTDEAAAVNPDSLKVRPYPKPIAIRAGSQPWMKDLQPAPVPGTVRRPGSDWWVSAPSIRPGAVAGATAPSLVIAPRYESGAATTLVTMRPAEAVVLLAENSFNLVGRQDGLAILAGVVARSACYRLSVGDLGAACRLVLGLVESLARQQRTLDTAHA